MLNRVRLPIRAKTRHHLLTQFRKINPQAWHCLDVNKLKNLLSLKLNSISGSISRPLEALASEVIFQQQGFHYHPQSPYSKLYLSVTHMFYNAFA